MENVFNNSAVMKEKYKILNHPINFQNIFEDKKLIFTGKTDFACSVLMTTSRLGENEGKNCYFSVHKLPSVKVSAWMYGPWSPWTVTQTSSSWKGMSMLKRAGICCSSIGCLPSKEHSAVLRTDRAASVEWLKKALDLNALMDFMISRHEHHRARLVLHEAKDPTISNPTLKWSSSEIIDDTHLGTVSPGTFEANDFVYMPRRVNTLLLLFLNICIHFVAMVFW